MFLAAAAARTAEALTTLDIISNGRVDFGIGEGATRLELGGFGIKAKDKRAMALEAALARKLWMQPLAPADIPVVRASVVRAQFNQTRGTGKA